MTTHIAIAGAAGRMGRRLIESCTQLTDTEVTVAFEYPESSFIGCDAGELAGIGKLDIPIIKELNEVINTFDVLVEFTTIEATLAHLALCRAA
ncbi:MAG: 4-hydroxy-tetrahydrodipicolinate reductase, partial [Thiomargarita sp.]|nr:4-hydroxy-tetrahydrodipicolinate reductase [Thiomargarita sp.]